MWRLFISLLFPLGLANSSFKDVDLESASCLACKLAATALKGTVDSDSFLQTSSEAVVKICEFVVTQDVCQGLINQYASLVISGLSGRYLEPEYVCFQLNYCTDPAFVVEDFMKWEQEVISDAPSIQDWPEPSSNSFKFLHLSDVHIDLLYKEGSIVDCPELTCCRYGESAEGAGHWGSFGKCDTPPQTVELFMEQVSKMDLSFVLWTGDSPPHDVNNYNENNHTDYAKFITELFKKYLPTVPVYPVLGNHGCFPMDEFGPGKEGWILEKYAEIWEDYLDKPALDMFKQNGYYSLKDENTGVRIIGLNTQLGDVFNFKIYANSTDPGNMLAWLRKELYSAEQANEKAYIFGHIPAGDHFTDSLWSKHYRVLVNRFRNTIMGQFFGHSHNDHFQLVSSLDEDSAPAGVILMVPSLTTYAFLNPSFRIYEADSLTYQPLDYHQYRLHLALANKQPDVKPEFELVYSAKSYYNLENLSPASYEALADFLVNDKEVLDKYYRNFYSSYEGEIEPCTTKCYTQLTCGALNSVFDEYYECAKVIELEEFIFRQLERFIEPWNYSKNIQSNGS
jgi:sphingomyelin phosphodiesterase